MASASAPRASTPLKRLSTRSPCLLAMACTSADSGSSSISSHASQTASRKRSSWPSAPIGNGLPKAD
eukprot:1288720-Prymnesium_polylepis.1